MLLIIPKLALSLSLNIMCTPTQSFARHRILSQPCSSFSPSCRRLPLPSQRRAVWQVSLCAGAWRRENWFPPTDFVVHDHHRQNQQARRQQVVHIDVSETKTVRSTTHAWHDIAAPRQPTNIALRKARPPRAQLAIWPPSRQCGRPALEPKGGGRPR
ncbi:hypothetical protein B0H14DRAFT_495455 [Mycena olivaceomarginata]|nr:hypothetical protein B0H14DRAFT_495455 [Mycena olivaceomarginata]